MFDGPWPGVDTSRFRVVPRRIFGPFYSVQIFDTENNIKVSVTGGAFLTGRASVQRAAKYATARYLRLAGRNESQRKRRPGWGAP